MDDELDASEAKADVEAASEVAGRGWGRDRRGERCPVERFPALSSITAPDTTAPELPTCNLRTTMMFGYALMMKPSVEAVLEDVHSVRTMLIHVGTGERRIQDVETEYIQLRNKLSKNLRELDIKDPNEFRSLWDWYGYWKDNGLGSYQSRREYVNSLYKPVESALEEACAVDEEPQGIAQPFSVRHGYAPDAAPPPIKYREDAPEDVRRTIIEIAANTGWDYDGILQLATGIGKRSWEPPEAIQSGTSSRAQLYRLVSTWKWFKVYDFVEHLYSAMSDWQMQGEPEDHFERKINEYFEHSGVGWRLDSGKITSRGSEVFEASVHAVIPVLQEVGLQTAEREIHEALSDLSRRPTPDLTGAIQHAMAALECVARKASGDPNPTLGKLLERHPGLIPKPLDAAVEKAWGFASERGRHIREGEEPTRADAELIVGMAATVATFLSRKLPD